MSSVGLAQTLIAIFSSLHAIDLMWKSLELPFDSKKDVTRKRKLSISPLPWMDKGLFTQLSFSKVSASTQWHVERYELDYDALAFMTTKAIILISWWEKIFQSRLHRKCRETKLDNDYLSTQQETSNVSSATFTFRQNSKAVYITKQSTKGAHCISSESNLSRIWLKA